MRSWLTPLRDTLRAGEAAVLVHVADLKGSGPREVGAQMLVTEGGLFGTIGGGQLEHSAMLHARELMTTGRASLVRWSLGPELAQCCGGAVTLAFEPFASADLAWVEKLFAASAEPVPLFRTLRIDENGAFRRDWRTEGGRGETGFVATLAAGRLILRERMNAAPPVLWLFGAGHVGRAVVSALRPLGFAITWIDGRAGQFPEDVPADIKTLALAMPELAVDEAPPATSFLVMTHSHPLDEAICEAVLRRDDFAYLGLIGSETKRARFRKRFAERGIGPEALQRLVCPIGLGAIRSKDPASIAVSVAADLLIRREQAVEKHGRRQPHVS